MRRFESNYRINEGDDVLDRENAIHQDVDLRLDAVELDAEAFRAGNRADIEAILASLETTFSQLAAEMRGLLDQTQGGLSADIITETAARYFLTDARRAAIMSDAVSTVRGGVDASADTLAKLLAKIASVSASLGSAATKSVGTSAGTVAAGDDSRIKGAVLFNGVQSLVGDDRRRAKQNLGLPGSGYPGGIGQATTLDASYIGQTLFLYGDNYVVTLPKMLAGDRITAFNFGGGKNIQLKLPSPSAYVYYGASGGQGLLYTIAPNGNVTIECFADNDGAVFIYDSAPRNSALDANTPQFFTDAQKGQLLANLGFANSLVPPGAIMWFGGSSAPAGWLKANGASAPRAAYPGLYSAILTTYGSVDASSFSLPDLRGVFLRGFDDGRGLDPGRVLGTFQADSLKDHQHLYSYLSDITIGGSSGARILPAGGGASTGSTGSIGGASAGGTETRGKNVALLACIKF